MLTLFQSTMKHLITLRRLSVLSFLGTVYMLLPLILASAKKRR